MSVLYDARDIGDDIRHVVVGYDAENGLERCERIVRDLGLGARHNGKERGLARIRESYETAVSDELELDREVLLLAGKTGCGELRRLPYGIGVVHVAETALAALGDYYPLFIFRKIRDDLACGKVLDDSSYRDPDNEILSVWKLKAPAPPSPAFTWILEWSINIIHLKNKRAAVISHDRLLLKKLS